jgi:hypothetical protein
LDQVGFKLPGWKVRQLLEEFDTGDAKHRSKLSLDEFEQVRQDLHFDPNVKLTNLKVLKSKYEFCFAALLQVEDVGRGDDFQAGRVEEGEPSDDRGHVRGLE